MANPNKTKPIMDILLRNKEKLIDFLTKFHTDRTGWYDTALFDCRMTHPEMGRPMLKWDDQIRNLYFLAEDQQFNDEKHYLIKQIRDMQPSSAIATATGGEAVAA